MAFLFDSMLWSAGLLFAATVAGWHLSAGCTPAARFNLRFACVLFAALALAGVIGAGLPGLVLLPLVVGLLAASLGSAALALGLSAALGRSAPVFLACASLLAALALGLGAALRFPILAVAAEAVAVSAMAALASGQSRWRAAQLLAGAAGLFCGGLALLQSAVPVAMLFTAAALISLMRASQMRVEQKRAGIFDAVIGVTRV